jgi:ribosomal protein L29
MKINELNILKKKKSEDLVKIIADKKKELMKTITQMKAGREKNLKKAKNLKIDIAQTKTVLMLQEIAENIAKKKGVKSE